jgi:hypothetical protein
MLLMKTHSGFQDFHHSLKHKKGAKPSDVGNAGHGLGQDK